MRRRRPGHGHGGRTTFLSRAEADPIAESAPRTRFLALGRSQRTVDAAAHARCTLSTVSCRGLSAATRMTVQPRWANSSYPCRWSTVGPDQLNRQGVVDPLRAVQTGCGQTRQHAFPVRPQPSRLSSLAEVWRDGARQIDPWVRRAEPRAQLMFANQAGAQGLGADERRFHDSSLAARIAPRVRPDRDLCRNGDLCARSAHTKKPRRSGAFSYRGQSRWK